MDQKQIGIFLKTLRKEKGITQEQLAKALNVSNRSVSRWENGVNLPDFSPLLEIAKYYEIGVDEILNGERIKNLMEDNNETLYQVAEYTNREKAILMKRMHYIFLLGIIAQVIIFMIETLELRNQSFYDTLSGFCLGISFGILIIGTIFTSRYRDKIREIKLRYIKNHK